MERAMKLKNEGNAGFKDGRFDLAIPAYTKALQALQNTKASPEVVALKTTLYSNRAACHLQSRNYDDTIADCDAALDLDPKHLKTLSRRAMAYEALEKFDQALADFRAVMNIDYQFPHASEGMNRVSKAINAHRKIEEEEKRGGRSGGQQKRRGPPAQDTQAREEIAKKRALEAKDKGNMAIKMQDYDIAVRWYTIAIENQPGNHIFYSNRSAAYAGKNAFADALQDAEKCVKMKADWPKSHFRLGVALSGLGRHREAYAAYSKCLSLDPSNQAVRGMMLDSKKQAGL